MNTNTKSFALERWLDNEYSIFPEVNQSFLVEPSAPPLPNTFECDICFINKNSDIRVLLECGHELCRECLCSIFTPLRTSNVQWCKTKSMVGLCPFCRRNVHT